MEFAVFTIVILIASILQTSTGFGFSILATPFLLLIFEPAEAIQINLILSLLISAALIAKVRKDVDIGVLKRFIAGSSLGLPVGIAVFLMIDLNSLKLMVSLLILLLTLMLIFKFRISRNNKRDLLVGGLSGSLTTSIGMPGPPILLYFSGTETKKETLRSTTLAFYLFIYLVSLIMQVSFAGTNKTVWLSSFWAIPLVAAGLYLGQLLFGRINQRIFRMFTYVILLFTGSYLLLESLGWLP